MADMWRIPDGSDQETFKYDADLPNLPVPPLNHTLNRYLESVHPFVNDKEYANTQEIVKKFLNGEGKELDRLLKQRAASHKNWVEEWWENYAYLECRQPLLPFCSMIGISAMEEVGWTPCLGTMVKRCALHLSYSVEIWEMLRTQKFVPAQTADGKTKFSMAQYRRLYNCNRYPLPKRDRLDAFFKTEAEGPCPSHIICLCNGQLYAIDAMESESGVALSPPEWELQLHLVLNDALNNPGPGLARLTCDNRDVWSENRSYLQRISLDNARYLDLIDTALFVLVLDSNTPQTESELPRALLCGDYANRWADKSLTLIFFQNGMTGGISEHTAFDGLVSITAMAFTLDRLRETGGVYKGSNKVRTLKRPKRLDFILDDRILDELDKAKSRQEPNISSVLVERERFTSFGKKAITKKRVHPDTFVQLALQLAYYSLHGRLAPCYETATTRAFYNGRTETHRPCTIQVAQWVHSMNDPNVKAEEKLRLMMVAAKRNDELMKEARENHGCDRHLFGLYCTALESGLPIPELFSDPAYTKSGGGGNFTLSTSLVGFFPTGGGMAAMTKEGYGIFYNILPDSIHFNLAAQREGETTSINKYFQMLSRKLVDMIQLLELAASSAEVRSKI